MTEFFEMYFYRTGFNYGLLQLGSGGTGGSFYGVESGRSDVVDQLLDLIGSSFQSYRVASPWFGFTTFTDDGGWLPTFDARYVAAAEGGGEIEALTKAWKAQVESDDDEYPWRMHARFISEVDPAAIDLAVAHLAPPWVINGRFSPLVAHPPELLPNFRSQARALLISVPLHHHRLRRARDEIALRILASDWIVWKAAPVSSGTSPTDEKEKIQYLFQKRDAEAALSFSGPRQAGRTSVHGNYDFSLNSPSADRPTSSMGFISAADLSDGTVVETVIDSGYGRARRQHRLTGALAMFGDVAVCVFRKWTEVPSDATGGQLGAVAFPPSPWIPAEEPDGDYYPVEIGLKLRGISFEVRATCATIVHEFGHLFMRRLFQWEWGGEPAASVQASEQVSFRARDGSEYFTARQHLLVDWQEYWGTFEPARQRVYSGGRFGIVAPEATQYPLLRWTDLAIMSSYFGLPEESSADDGPAIVEWLLTQFDARVGLADVQECYELTEVPIQLPNNLTKSGALGRRKLYGLVDGGEDSSMNPRFKIPELEGWFSTAAGSYSWNDRMEFEAETYRSFALQRASFWDRVNIASAIRQVGGLQYRPASSLFPTCSTAVVEPGAFVPGEDALEIQAGGYHGFREQLRPQSLIELMFRTMAAVFSVTFAHVEVLTRQVTSRRIAHAIRADGCQIAYIPEQPASARRTVETAFVTRLGVVHNRRALYIPATHVDVAFRADGGVRLICCRANAAPVLVDLPEGDAYFDDTSAAYEPLELASSFGAQLSGVVEAQVLEAPPSIFDALVLLRDADGRAALVARVSGSWSPASLLGSDLGNVEGLSLSSVMTLPWIDAIESASSGSDSHRHVVAVARRTLGSSLVTVSLVEIPPGDDASLALSVILGLPIQSQVYDIMSITGAELTSDRLRFALGTPRRRLPLDRDPAVAPTGLVMPMAIAFPVESGLAVLYGVYELGVGPIGPLVHQLLEGVTLVDLTVGLNSIQVMCRREGPVGIETPVFECFLPPDIREGGLPYAVWRFLRDDLRPPDDVVASLGLSVAEAEVAALMATGVESSGEPAHAPLRRLWDASMPVDWHWMEHRLWATGDSGEQGLIAALPTLSWPPTEGDTISFLHLVSRTDGLQYTVTTEGGWRGQRLNRPANGPDAGQQASDEEQIQATLEQGRWAAKSATWPRYLPDPDP